MNEKQGTRAPTPAAKPPHLTSRPSSQSTGYALKGASNAFEPKVSTEVRQSTTTSNAISAATIASGTSSRGRTGSAGSTLEVQQEKRSPSRGRHLHPNNAQLAGARSATSNTRSPAKVASNADRPTSAIAARLASTNSSPVRSSPSSSPKRTGFLSSSGRTRGISQSLEDAAALSGAIASISSSPSKSEEIGGVRSRMLHFEKIPNLSPQRYPATNTTGSSGLAAARSAFRQPSPSRNHTNSSSIVLGEGNTEASEIERSTEGGYRHNSDISEKSLPTSLRPRATSQQNDTRHKPMPPAPRRGFATQQRQQQTGVTKAPALPVRDIKSGMTVHHLADAMVASSLASTRTSSPTKDHPSNLRRRSASVTDIRTLASKQEAYRHAPPRPPRPMKHTLRKHSSDNEEDDIAKRGRRHLVRKHPNMHHEGDRKRWRDKITDRERKRYEGLFAANRGVLLRSVNPRSSPSRLVDPAAEGNQVVNVVVRDIWERSRLPRDALREIYELVAPDNLQTLNREQFVVGLWLIDQKLKGRKLPVKVSQSVWASVRHPQGITIRKAY